MRFLFKTENQFVVNAIALLVCLVLFACYSLHPVETKINGISIVPPERKVNDSFIKAIKNVNANYVSVNPVGLCKQSKPMLFYNKPTQWWGETMSGTQWMIQQAHDNKLHVMLEPRIAISGQVPPADFNLKDAATWSKWQSNYSKLIIDYAKLAQNNQVEIFCIGTDLMPSVTNNPEFWIQLIIEVRKVYNGKITYAASWQNYNQISFWDELDFIGVNAYFPLTNEKTPDVRTLMHAWQQPLNEMKTFSAKLQKQVLFTEFGYRSMNSCAWKQNELPNDFIYEGNANTMAQAACYAAMFTALWKQNWFAGGFCYKWYCTTNAGGKNNNDYSPQNKLAEEVLKKGFNF